MLKRWVGSKKNVFRIEMHSLPEDVRRLIWSMCPLKSHTACREAHECTWHMAQKMHAVFHSWRMLTDLGMLGIPHFSTNFKFLILPRLRALGGTPRFEIIWRSLHVVRMRRHVS